MSSNEWSDPITPGLADRRPPKKPPNNVPPEGGMIILPTTIAPSSYEKCRECGSTVVSSEAKGGVCLVCLEKSPDEELLEEQAALEPPRVTNEQPVRPKRTPSARGSLQTELVVMQRIAEALDRLGPESKKRVLAWLRAWDDG